MAELEPVIIFVGAEESPELQQMAEKLREENPDALVGNTLGEALNPVLRSLDRFKGRSFEVRGASTEFCVPLTVGILFSLLEPREVIVDFQQCRQRPDDVGEGDPAQLKERRESFFDFFPQETIKDERLVVL